MRVSLLPGFSPAIIAQNADALVTAGKSRNTAARQSIAHARVCAFRSGDVLPAHLAQSNHFTRDHYDSFGFHISKFIRAASKWIETNESLYAERPSRHVRA